MQHVEEISFKMQVLSDEVFYVRRGINSFNNGSIKLC
jgi:hypothetical protein